MIKELNSFFEGCLKEQKTDFDRKEWVIFGCGIRGRRALEILRRLGISVSFFVDNDGNRVGETIDGITCESKEKLDQKSYCILVSPASDESLYKDLKSKYKYVFPTGIINFLHEIVYSHSYLDKGYHSVHEFAHYYNPYPDLNWVKEYEKGREKDLFRDIDFNLAGQRAVLNKILALFDSLPDWRPVRVGGGINEKSGYRYEYKNDFYDIVDAVILHGMLRLIKPRRLIEVGSGYSSAVTLDTNEYYFNGDIKLTFIEPYPDRLKKLLKESDRIELYEQPLQETDLSLFQELEAGDILFIDSSHVSKRGSDVNRIFFEILPALRPGVYIHIHDIMPEFEYPIDWLERGSVWNEMYILRAFLQNNSAYRIELFLGIMERKYGEEMRAKWPYDHYRAGSAFWMKKL